MPKPKKIPAALWKPLRRALGRSFPLWFDVISDIIETAEALPKEAGRPKFEEPSWAWGFAIGINLLSMGSVVRRAVKEGLDPEIVHAQVVEEFAELLKTLLTDDTEHLVLGLYALISDKIDDVFDASGLWDALNDIHDHLDDPEPSQAWRAAQKADLLAVHGAPAKKAPKKRIAPTAGR